jgi:hypothetical protein
MIIPTEDFGPSGVGYEQDCNGLSERRAAACFSDKKVGWAQSRNDG